MGNYGTIAGVFELFPRIGSISIITSALVESYLGRSNARINALLSGRYTVPVTGSPPLLKDAEETLSLARLLKRFYTQEKENTSEWVQGWFDEVTDMLEPVVSGSGTLTASDGTRLEANLVTTTPWSSTDLYRPTFGVRDLVQTRIDPDRDKAEEDADVFK
jgi:phage gp36-like protein